jgi:DNA-binding beta-propeller fold protein YncE
LAFDHPGNLYVANFGSNTVVKVNKKGEQSVLFGGGFFRPSGLAFDRNGALYVSSPTLGQIVKEEDGELSIFTQAGFLEGPFGVAFSR